MNIVGSPNGFGLNKNRNLGWLDYKSIHKKNNVFRIITITIFSTKIIVTKLKNNY
jgi:hypothetical protein